MTDDCSKEHNPTTKPNLINPLRSILLSTTSSHGQKSSFWTIPGNSIWSIERTSFESGFLTTNRLSINKKNGTALKFSQSFFLLLQKKSFYHIFFIFSSKSGARPFAFTSTLSSCHIIKNRFVWMSKSASKPIFFAKSQSHLEIWLSSGPVSLSGSSSSLKIICELILEFGFSHDLTTLT